MWNTTDSAVIISKVTHLNHRSPKKPPKRQVDLINRVVSLNYLIDLKSTLSTHSGKALRQNQNVDIIR